MKLTAVATLAASVLLSGALLSAPAHADAGVCKGAFDRPAPESVGLHVVHFAIVTCSQQADSLRYEVSLEHISAGQSVWSTDDHQTGDATMPLTKTVPLSGKCVTGRWHTRVEVWDRIAGHAHHEVYLSEESLMRTFDCIQKDF